MTCNGLIIIINVLNADIVIIIIISMAIDM